MTIARRQAVHAFRNDPLHLVLAVIGVNLTGATMAFAVRDVPDMGGDPRIELGAAPSEGAEGIRLLSAETDEDGIATSVVEIIADKATMQALPAAAETGDAVTLAYDFQWDLASAIGGIGSAVEETVLFGEFIVRGSCND